MPSNVTQNYRLNQWSKDDRIQMEDFNADNARIDAAIAAEKAAREAADQSIITSKADASALNALKTVVAEKGNCRMEVGSYVGDGTKTVSFSTSIFPKAFIVIGDGANTGISIRPNDKVRLMNHSTNYIGDLTWRGNGVTWTNTNNATSDSNILNSKNQSYYYIVFG